MNFICIQHDVERNGKNLDQFLSEMRERERKQRVQLYIRIALGAAFLIVLIIGLTRRRKMQQKKTR